MVNTVRDFVKTPVTVTKHAAQRIHERFGISVKKAEKFANQCLSNAKFLAVVDHHGNKVRLFAYRGKVFVLNLEKDVVVTVYKSEVYDEKYPNVLSDKVRQFTERELRKAERQEQTIERRGMLEIAEIKIEIAEREYELLRARSLAKKLALIARIEALKQAIDDRMAQINEMKYTKKLVAKSAAAFM
jgi:hypothetical protein